MTTFRARIICSFWPGGGCARNGRSMPLQCRVAIASSSRRWRMSWVQPKSSLTPAPITAASSRRSSWTKGAFKRIVAIEPDPSNRARLEENLRRWLPDDPRVTVCDCVLADDQREAPFHDGLDYASQLSATGRMRVMTHPLDALDLSPTFVKLHLEGGELAALKGARQTLLTHRPVLAATVYHNADGIWKTPHWLMDNLPDYRFLFRVHAWCGNGAVVYAIPRERFAP